MLSQHEREVLTEAVADWAAAAADLPAIGFIGHVGIMSASELAEATLSGSPDGEAFLALLEHGVRLEGLEAVVARIGLAKQFAPATGGRGAGLPSGD